MVYASMVLRTFVVGARPESGELADSRKVLLLLDIKHRPILPGITNERDTRCDLAVNNAQLVLLFKGRVAYKNLRARRVDCAYACKYGIISLEVGCVCKVDAECDEEGVDSD
jgi:hypothetical protein